MPKESKFVLCLKELGFKPFAEVMGAEVAAQQERKWKEVEENVMRGMNRAERRRWNRLGKIPRFARIADMTFATDDTDHHWAAEGRLDLQPFGFADMLAYASKKILAFSGQLGPRH